MTEINQLIPANRKGIGGHHRGHRGKSDVWLTPPAIIEALGPFDLDPCACDPRPWDTAAVHWHTNGLDRDWFGRVWLNSPYGPELGKWLAKLADHGNGVAIAFARTETAAFFAHVWPRASALLFVKGRLHFHYPDGERADANAGGPSVLIAYGPGNAERLRTCAIDGQFLKLHNLIRSETLHQKPQTRLTAGKASSRERKAWSCMESVNRGAATEA